MIEKFFTSIASMLVGRATPNQITGLRMISGVLACLLIAMPITVPGLQWIAAALWAVSISCDHLDGALARLTNMVSAKGRQYDFIGDMICNTGIFLAMSIRLSLTHNDWWPLALGAIAGIGVSTSIILAEKIERCDSYRHKAIASYRGIDPDDAMLVLVPIIGFNWISIVLVPAAIGGVIAVLGLSYMALHSRKG